MPQRIPCRRYAGGSHHAATLPARGIGSAAVLRHGHRAAQARRHDRAGECRSHAAPADVAREVSLPERRRRQGQLPRHLENHARDSSADAGRRRQGGQRALGGNGHDRRGPADRVRERDESAARALREAPPRARGARRARRRRVAHHADAAHRERSARSRGRCRRRRARVRRAHVDQAVGARNAAPHRRDRARRARARFHARGFYDRGPRARARPGTALRRPQDQRGATRRRTQRHAEQSAVSLTERARRGAGGARAGAPRELGAHDSHVASVARGRPRLHAAASPSRSRGFRFLRRSNRTPRASRRCRTRFSMRSLRSRA